MIDFLVLAAQNIINYLLFFKHFLNIFYNLGFYILFNHIILI